MSEDRVVRGQYATAERLNIRISIHEKYSVNRQGFGNWILSQYAFRPGDRVLEVGCGTAAMWKEGLKKLPAGCRLTLTDLSEGMLEEARNNLGERDNLEYALADIQRLPYGDGEFDAVIANMMLYHVPDIPGALGEVRRVLKKGGAFYCATYGEHGIVEYLADALRGFPVNAGGNRRFTLQNGGAALEGVFAEVARLDYEDALLVTSVEDLIDYLYSLSGMTGLTEDMRGPIARRLEERMENGALRVPKEYGMFICG